MAKRETIVVSCDLHDGEFTEGVETVPFGLDGTAYEVDACEEHRAQLHDAFAPFVGAARKPEGSGRGSGGRRTSRATSGGRAASGGSGGGVDREEVQRIREWARSNGHQVSERGRLSGAVLEAYRAAH